MTRSSWWADQIFLRQFRLASTSHAPGFGNGPSELPKSTFANIRTNHAERGWCSTSLGRCQRRSQWWEHWFRTRRASGRLRVRFWSRFSSEVCCNKNHSICPLFSLQRLRGRHSPNSKSQLGSASPGAKISNKVTLDALGATWKFLPHTSGRVRRSAGFSWSEKTWVKRALQARIFWWAFTKDQWESTCKKHFRRCLRGLWEWHQVHGNFPNSQQPQILLSKWMLSGASGIQMFLGCPWEPKSHGFSGKGPKNPKAWCFGSDSDW